MLVPQRSVLQSPSGAFVYVVSSDGKVEQRVVKAGGWNGNDWIVTDTQTTDGYGSITWINLPAGSYGLDQCLDLVQHALASREGSPAPDGEQWRADRPRQLAEGGGAQAQALGYADVSVLHPIHSHTPRPMTHDLLKSVLDGLGVSVRQVIVNDLKDNTFFAVIELNHNGSVINIDSRPSDAIALALRVNAPIFVTEKVVSQAKSVEISEEKEETDKWKEWLENLKPEDFGKYKM